MPPRTNACATCRKKRWKCDGTLPHCLMCIRTGKQCPGVDSGPLIIDMTIKIASKTQNHKKSKYPPKHLPEESQSLVPAALTLPAEVMMMTAPIFQPSQVFMVQEAFYANFLSYFTSTGEGRDLQNRMTWMHRLPQLSSDGSNEALSMALRASATAYCGVEASNPSVLKDAYKLYGKSLQLHAYHVKKNSFKPNIHLISTSVMLSLFEAMQATTADAYREHVYAAAKMTELMDAGDCMEGVLCSLFFHIRTQMAFVFLTTSKQQPILIHKILMETLAYKKLPTFQKIMTQIARLAEIYLGKTSSSAKEQLINLQEYISIKTEVETLWHEYETEGIDQGHPLTTLVDGKPTYRDGFTALVVAYFLSARILLQILSPRLGSTYLDFNDYYAPILECATFLETKRIGCAYMRLAMPLYLVAVHSPIEAQRNQAIEIFESWKRSSLSGISCIALQRIGEQQIDRQIEEVLGSQVIEASKGMDSFGVWPSGATVV